MDKTGISSEPPLMKIMKTPAKVMKKPLDREKSRTLEDKKEKKRNLKKVKALKIKRAKQKEKHEKEFLKNQKRSKNRALHAGREHIPQAKSLAKVLQIASAASSEAKDAKKIATSAKKESREAKKESHEAKEDVKQGRADQDKFMIKYDCELQKVKDILQICEEDAEDVCMEHSPSPRHEKACDREESTPPCATPPRQRHARYLQQKGNPFLNAGPYTKEERVRKGLATWNEGTANDK